MLAIDTNILVRFLIGDDKKQAEKVYAIFKKVEEDKIELFIPFIVIVELIWVLESAYDIPRSKILDSISDLLLMAIFNFENLTTLQEFISSAQKTKYDLSDLLIAYSAKNNGCDKVITFDKKAAKFDLFELVK